MVPIRLSSLVKSVKAHLFGDKSLLLFPYFFSVTTNILSKFYNCVVDDTTQVMNRIKAIYRGRGIGCAGGGVYRPDQRQPWLAQLPGPAV